MKSYGQHLELHQNIEIGNNTWYGSETNSTTGCQKGLLRASGRVVKGEDSANHWMVTFLSVVKILKGYYSL